MNEIMRILLADDDTEFCARMSAVLDSADDFELVGIAENGEKALSAVNELRPDVLIIELMLPVMDGWAVCREIRAESDVPIIMLTAKGETADRVSGLVMGADDYIVKPFEVKELLARVSVAVLCADEQCPAGVAAQDFQGGRVDTADLDFSKHKKFLPSGTP